MEDETIAEVESIREKLARSDDWSRADVEEWCERLLRAYDDERSFTRSIHRQLTEAVAKLDAR